ncbi:sporulation related domain protein [Lysobacter antibioticus]|uniref:Sporulation related domain protein n=1 Tax=Lysobacter antibioticus TaxID=84531 RepID=A0A0S2F6N4_LYSAN|nr:SPOR domain-containing protein [Lysobacter antibioticus]ALN63029.1 sporulation related domain protein [Lysobacter antibioticus]ALN79155.1 sporulation related domain protein [Lysobacter antibioticus]
MLVRALIVLLIALNIGVAAWWVARPVPAAAAEEKLPLGVARLQLAGESAPAAQAGTTAPSAPPAALVDSAGKLPASNAAPPQTDQTEAAKAEAAAAKLDAASGTPPAAPPPTAATPTAATPVPAVAETAKAQCFSIGPFADAAAADAARAKLQPLAQKLATRAQAGTSNPSRGWRVYLPPAASAEAAQATAQRIRAAGFSDLFVMGGGGADANGIALGRFRSEESARKRASSLSEAGFPARVEALGETVSATWIDAATTTSNGDALRRAAGAQRWRTVSCGTLG